MMRKITYLFLLFLLISGNANSQIYNNLNPTDNYNYLKENFKTPDTNYGVNCWWWWLNGNVTKEAITKDLEAMKSRNFQGAMIFDAGGHNQRGNNDIPDGPLFGSDEWNKLFVFAMDEAKRLGLEMGFNIQSGWNLGGPRVTPEYTAKQITYSEAEITGNKKVTKKLDLPRSRKDFYKDIAVLAFPLKKENKTKEVISDLDLKLGYHELGGSAPDTRFLLGNIPGKRSKRKSASTYIVKKEDILNLSSKMDSEGVLNWDAPEGEWRIIRLGYTCTKSHVSTSSGDWQGSVLDYMSKEAFDFYWNDVVEPIFKAAGEHVGTTLKFMETDSWECGGMNWTDNFPEEFKNYRGYDILSYLPVVAGYIIDDIETSNAFLADFRKTLGDLVAYNHYARFQKYAHKYNMGIQPESAGPHAGPMDGIKNYGFSDIVMSEFWSPSPHRPRPYNRFFLKQASSAAHIYGKKIVGAESFTTIKSHWDDELWHNQKSAFDHEICAGLNRMYFHTFTCSPKEMGLPGQEYFAGTHVNPQVTWWEQSGAFIDYMHRTQFIVQNGKFVADILYYYGDHVPNVFPYKHSDPAGVMPGFDYDVTDETILLQLKLKNGKMVVPGGVEYRVLVLPDHKVLSMAVLEKVEELLQLGAQVIGYKPEKLVCLTGGEKEQKRFSKLADKIWGMEVSDKGEKSYGKGTVAWGVTAREYLISKDIKADFNITESDSKTDFDFIHYTIGESDVYFVSNQTEERKKVNCQFRVSELQPELWDALSGETRDASAFSQKDGITSVPLTLEPYGALFVVFNRKIDKNRQGTEVRNYAEYKTVKNIDGEWIVNFDPDWGPFDSAQGTESGEFIFDKLQDWAKHPNEGIKYYSGAAVYKKTFNIDFEPQKGEKYFLQLGSVKDVGIAEVKINGTDKGVVWTKPFRVDITNELQKGDNTLEIKVVNSWYNRVAGDEISSGKKKYTSTNIVLKHDFRGKKKKDIPMKPSGLLGPVSIKEAIIIGGSGENQQGRLKIDNETIKEWSKPYRNWHYHPNHVIRPNPKIKGFKDVKMTDVPTVFQIPGDNKWYMTFIGFDGKGYQSFIAESDDLVNWNNLRLAMGYGPKDSFDYGGVVLGAYLYGNYDIKAPRTLKKKDGKYFSLYGAYPRQGGYELRPGYEGVASGKDGISWQREIDKPILSIYQDDCGAWEKDCIYQPWLIEYKGKYYNFYNAANGSIEQIGAATSDDLLNWKRHDHNPVIPVNQASDSYNNKFSSDGKIFWDKDHWVCFFFGVGNGGAHIMTAFSYDLYNWTVDPEPIYKAGGNPSGLDSKYAHKISLVWNPENETYYMFYCAVDKNNKRGIGLITSKPIDK